MAMALQVGDRVRTNSHEVGIVCHTNPYIMRIENFHSYVVFDPTTTTLLATAVDPAAFVRKELLTRIQRYIDAHPEKFEEFATTPTGG